MSTETTRTSDEDLSGPSGTSPSGRGTAQAGLLNTVLDSLVVGVLVLDADGRVVLANRTVYETLGVPVGSLTGERLDPLVMAGFDLDAEGVGAADDLGDQIPEWWRDDPAAGPQFHEVTRLRFRYELPGGSARRGWITTRNGVDDDGEPVVVVSISDITAQEDEREQLRHRASTDTLTGLDNRAVLSEDALGRYVTTAAEHGQPSGSALFIDLDGFKQVNDELGHGTGDRVLEIVGRRLRESFRQSDVATRVSVEVATANAVVARYGGDEFVVLTDATGTQEIESLVTRVHETITGPVDVDGRILQVEASIGWALIEPGSSIRSVLEAADRRVYEAKSLNRPPA